MVPLTRDFRETVAERIKNDPACAQALLEEAVTLFAEGDIETAKLILCAFDIPENQLKKTNSTNSFSASSLLFTAIKYALEIKQPQTVSAV
ncbi:MAG: transcriptional regulator [Acetobacter sp.]|nr:transcriptional regulator [Acetobacter sp.]